MNRMAAALIAVTMLVVPASASAQSTTPAPATPAPTTSGAPAPVPAKGKLKLSLQRVGSGGVLAGSRWVVRGTLTPYVPGQQASVRFYRHNRKIAVNEVSIGPAGGKAGRFTLGFRARTPGTITVRATHRATPELATVVAPRVSVSVLPLRATPGARGLAVRVLQQRLSRLGYVVGQRGLYDERTARAVTAFRKVTGMERTTIATSEVFRRLAKGQGRFHVRYPNHGRHVEGDIGHQVLALINGRRVERIYPMSSGKPSTPTVIGNFRVYMRELGTNGHGMVDSSYFIRGYAIHGYADVPVYNASHGCLRIPVPDAASVYRWVRLGTRVDTYR
jgi:hypothetical protein